MIEETEIIVIDEADEVVSEQNDQEAVPVIEKDRVIVAKRILARGPQEHQRIN